MSDSDLTPLQLAKLLEVDASTLRRWARTFASHLSQQAQGQGARRRYTSNDLATLTRARDLLHAGKRVKEVDALLGTVEPMDTQAAQVPAVAAAQLPAMAVELSEARELVRSMMAQLEAMHQDHERVLGEMDLLRAAHDDQGARVARLIEQIRGEVATLQVRATADREKVVQLTAELEQASKRPWWRRLFGGN